MKLKELRALNGLSQTELTKRTGVKQSIISAIESNTSDGYSFKTMKLLADALGVTVLDIEEFAAKIREEETEKFPTWSEEELAEVLTRLENKPTRSNEEARAIFADFREALKNKYSSGVRISA